MGCHESTTAYLPDCKSAPGCRPCGDAEYESNEPSGIVLHRPTFLKWLSEKILSKVQLEIPDSTMGSARDSHISKVFSFDETTSKFEVSQMQRLHSEVINSMHTSHDEKM